jgi:sulfur relay (sulfurtransferase) complex TusBCD TusD component (DsrE family)
LARADLSAFEDKIAIAKNKTKLKGQDCYIDNALRVSLRKMQAEICSRAKEERGVATQQRSATRNRKEMEGG